MKKQATGLLLKEQGKVGYSAKTLKLNCPIFAEIPGNMYASLQNLTAAIPQRDLVIEHLERCITTRSFSKDTWLIKEGQHCNHIYLVESGFARIFSNSGEKEVTVLFARENDIITSTYSLFTGNASKETIQLLEDSLLLQINYKELISLCGKHREIFEFYRLLMEKYYLLLEERTFSLQFENAYERYENILRHQPYILQRAPLGQVASYLGMSPVTLSRMRGNIKK